MLTLLSLSSVLASRMSAVVARVYTSSEVRSLYRALLRAGRSLQLSDEGWYRRQLRRHFEQHRDRSDNRLYVQVRSSPS